MPDTVRSGLLAAACCCSVVPGNLPRWNFNIGVELTLKPLPPHQLELTQAAEMKAPSVRQRALLISPPPPQITSHECHHRLARRSAATDIFFAEDDGKQFLRPL